MKTFAKLKDEQNLDILTYIPNVSKPSENMIKEYAVQNGYKIVEFTTQPHEYSYYIFKENAVKISQYWYNFTYEMIYDDCIAKCQKLLDETAQSHGYDNIQSLVSYIDDPNKKFDSEAKAGKNWRSAVWTKIFDILNKLKIGEIKTPKSWQEIEQQLPKISWPNN